MDKLLISAMNKGFAATFRLTKEDSIPIVLGMMQKWLREKHKIDIIMGKFLDMYIVFVYYYNRIIPIYEKDSLKKFVQYEDALETGLKEGLKLIK